jgi:hypothetical protein
VTGQVDIPWSRILVKSLPDSAVAVSDDVTVIYDDLPPVPKAAPLPMEIRLAIRLGDDVRLEAMGLKTKVGGALNIRQDPSKPLSGNGQLELRDGRFKAYGQNLIIKEGRILFSGPIDQPYLNIETYRDPDTIEDKVTGRGAGDGAGRQAEDHRLFRSRRWRSPNSSPTCCGARDCRPAARMAASTACWWRGPSARRAAWSPASGSPSA